MIEIKDATAIRRRGFYFAVSAMREGIGKDADHWLTWLFINEYNHTRLNGNTITIRTGR